MAYLNKTFLIGNLTRDPVLRTTPKGTSICDFGLAVNRDYKVESGETKTETTFVDIEAWGKQGELVSQYVKKGDPLFVEGRLRFDQWDDKTTGQKRHRLKLVLINMQFLGHRKADPNDVGSEADDEGQGHENPAPHSGGRKVSGKKGYPF